MGLFSFIKSELIDIVIYSETPESHHRFNRHDRNQARCQAD